MPDKEYRLLGVFKGHGLESLYENSSTMGKAIIWQNNFMAGTPIFRKRLWKVLFFSWYFFYSFTENETAAVILAEDSAKKPCIKFQNQGK